MNSLFSVRNHLYVVKNAGRRLLATKPRVTIVNKTTQGRTQTLKQRLMAPAGDSAFNLGKGALAGASVMGLGALCYYGMGLSNETGTLERSALWPEYVKDRVKATYLYFGSGIAVTAVSALGASRSAMFMRLMSGNPWLVIGGSMVALIGSSMLCQSMPYTPGLGGKQLAWLVHAGVMGAVIAPICFIGGPILTRAAIYTAGVIGGLSTVAVCAPSDKFLNMAGPLGIGLGVVLVSNIAGMFLPASTAIGAGLYSISMYGGLILFSGFLLYDTQKIMRRAETHPYYSTLPFDPVNSSLGIYVDTVNIFIRIAMILSGGGGRRK